jgi:UDP-glucose 4-epimerase
LLTQGQNRSLWILGHGGFLGSAVAREASAQGYKVFPQVSIPWVDPDTRSLVLNEIAKQFAVFACESEPTIIWAAGAQGVESSQGGISTELDSFHDFVNVISRVHGLHGSTVAIVSSAGGVYSGSPEPPFNSASPVNAINQYGLNKIAIEEIAATRLSENFRVQIARVTNLYGPWPGLRQGLINRLCTAAATREALQIYVPLDTVRDYIYVDDAAQLLLLELDFARSSRPATQLSASLIGSSENSSIGSVIDTVTHVTHRKVPVTMARLAATQLQARDLRMNPSWIERELPFAPMPLAQGVNRLFDSLVTLPRWTQIN